MEDKEILDQFGLELIGGIKQNLAANADRLDVFLINENGEAAASLDEKATNEALLITGSPYLVIAERGRGKTVNPGDGAVRRAVKRWIEKEGIVSTYVNKATKKPFTTDAMAFFISRKIHKYGTDLYQAGGNSGIISDVVTPERIDALVDSFSTKYFNSVSSQILNAFQ